MTPTPPKEPALPPRGAFVPRAIVNRDTRGLVKLVVERLPAGSGACTPSPRLAAQSFSRDVTKLSCCAA
jgi:hypothetical protein